MIFEPVSLTVSVLLPIVAARALRTLLEVVASDHNRCRLSGFSSRRTASMSKLRPKDAVAVFERFLKPPACPFGGSLFCLKSEDIPLKQLITGLLLIGMLAMAGSSEARKTTFVRSYSRHHGGPIHGYKRHVSKHHHSHRHSH